MFKFYTGLTVKQFDHLFGNLESAAQGMTYWDGQWIGSTKKHVKTDRKLSLKNELLLTFMKLRQNFPTTDLAYKYNISVGLVSRIVNTWIQFLYKQTECL